MDLEQLIGWHEVEQLIGSKMEIESSDWMLILPNCQLKVNFLVFQVVGFAGFLSVYDRNSRKKILKILKSKKVKNDFRQVSL